LPLLTLSLLPYENANAYLRSVTDSGLEELELLLDDISLATLLTGINYIYGAQGQE
jgi:hypothetical protein